MLKSPSPLSHPVMEFLSPPFCAEFACPSLYLVSLSSPLYFSSTPSVYMMTFPLLVIVVNLSTRR